MAWLTIDGARLYYETAGEGRPVFVFVHGGLCTHGDWAAQVCELQADGQVVTLDLRGHGQSTGEASDCRIERWAADVNALIDALGLGPVVLTGHSLASRIVAEATFQRPANVAALVLLDGSRSDGGLSATSPLTPAARVAPPTLEHILDATVGPYANAETRLHLVSNMGAAHPALMQATVEAMRVWDLERADTVFAGLAPHLPVMAIQSTYHDRFTPRRSLASEAESTPYLDFLKSMRADILVRVLPATGHFSMIERSGAVTALIRAFAAARPPAGPADGVPP